MSSEDVVILSANRTPIGKLRGSLCSLAAHELGSIAIQDGLQRAGIEASQVSEVLMGQVLTANAGQNPARQAAMKAGLPKEVPSTSINMLCGSGLKTVALGCQAIRCGDARVVVAGGQESMSQAPHCLQMREGVKFGHTSLSDSMLKDGLWDAFNDYHMGITAENVAKQFEISRQQQDEFAAQSQSRTEAAQKAGLFSTEITAVSITSRKGTTVIVSDEFPQHGTTAEGLGKLRPAFLKDGSGTVTAGNASGLNDGAAVVVLASAGVASQLSSVTPMARVVSWAQVGVDPSIMGMGPVPAIKSALAKASWSLDDVDLYELNEAFAAQSLAVMKELGLNPSKVNTSGGAIALGHPIGASGTRILVTLLHALQRTGLRKGVAALCIGGGMGIALCVERTD